jgi:hypothetical protein
LSSLFRGFARLRGGLLVVLLGLAATAVQADTTKGPLALRIQSLLVSPSSLPLVTVEAKNLQQKPVGGTIELKAPEGWKVEPPRQPIELDPGQTGEVVFHTAGGTNLAANRYPMKAVAVLDGGESVEHEQAVVVASAPYYKPEIDGKTDDWKDAIPITFTAGGKKTVIATYWSRREFALLVGVEENELLRPNAEGPRDAVQFALAPRDAVSPEEPQDETERFEFLLTPGEGGGGTCYQLAEPGMKAGELAEARPLAELVCEKAEVAVSRDGPMTWYECSLPMRPMYRDLRPSEGREFRFSVLVHDPGGTGVRDWGEAAGLWPCRRNRLAWSDWPGAQWGDQPPMDSKLPWGMCSSKY